MAGKSNDEHKFSNNESNIGDAGDNIKGNDENMENLRVEQQNDSLTADENSSNSMECGSRKEENPFSFKKFLNQDVTNYKPQNLRRKNYSPETSCCENSSSENQNYNFTAKDNKTKVMNTSEMTSVLPDFVQDHLVIEQCYLNGNSSMINIENLNLHNLPDLNVEHRLADFSVNTSGQRNDLNHHSLSGALNNLPDFAVNTNNVGLRTLDRENEIYLSGGGGVSSNMQTNVQRISDISGGSGCNRSSVRLPSSPSNFRDLPSYDRLESPSASATCEQPFPLDLTVAAEDRDGSYVGMQSAETISKSLPDFLSDGPIQNDRLGENLQLGDLVNSLHDNDNQRISAENVSDGFDQNRFQRELNLLRRQVSEKNRKIHLLESEIEDLRSRERTDLSSLDYAMLLQMERNFKHAVERASHAESALMKSRQENNRLRSKLASLTGENTTSKLSRTTDNANEVDESQRIADELRLAANVAENSLRSLLTGIDNLRMIAASVENMHNYNDKTDDTDDFNGEESASGPAL